MVEGGCASNGCFGQIGLQTILFGQNYLKILAKYDKQIAYLAIYFCFFGPNTIEFICIWPKIKHQNVLMQLKQEFINRCTEQKTLAELSRANEAVILMVYGRRRVGKTELIEHCYQERNLLKFEGIENKPEEVQRQHVMRQLAKYTDEPLLKDIRTTCWLDVFDYIHKYTQTGTWTIYFEEVQWLANYADNFISELKHAWDNEFRHNDKLVLILCGSSPSFMIKQVVYSKALYNRSQYEVHLQAFSLQQTAAFLKNKSKREIMGAYLSVGGIPEYLKRLKNSSSIYLGLCQLSFEPNGYFVNECERIFVSSLGKEGHYRDIIEFLSKQRFATRDEIATHLKLRTGGRLTSALSELELCGFIEKYTPYNASAKSTLARYHITDNYLRFYFRFIKPKLNAITSGQFVEQPTQALTLDEYQHYLAYEFERYCQKNAHLIAKILGFSGVRYQAGAYFSRATNAENKGYQIDLLFDRDDHVITICEIKFSRHKINRKVIDEFNHKLERFTNKKKKTIQRVLICMEGVDDSLINEPYFDRIITLDDLLT